MIYCDTSVPVEYAVAVDRYLAAAPLGEGSRRVYRIALANWAWLLAGRPVPVGAARRGAHPPVLPLKVLDGPGAAELLRGALDRRCTDADPRTVHRELSILRGALAHWQDLGWIAADPAAGLRPLPRPDGGAAALGPEQLRAVLALRVPLRERVTWRLLHESGARVEAVLALDVDDLDLLHRRTRPRTGRPALHWQAASARLLPLLVAGRTEGPLLLTERRAPAGTPAADRCPYTGRSRLSYRRAAELLTTATRRLDPAGRGYTLHQLRPGPATES
ncbi:hypothetical protein [Kitasatospora sp. NPDC059571]|uniref:hypothetical protein n=1 Tax=Kitasatospora sp. NPDC059571 TaxID=3346871 RepID=UPI0036778BC2